MKKSLTSALEIAKTNIKTKINIDIQLQSKTSIQEVNSRVDALESKIINFIKFIKKDLREKENHQNLLNNYKAKHEGFNDQNMKETNINKKTFEEKFAEISQIPNKLKAEFDLEIPNHDNLYMLVKSAKDDLLSSYKNKNEKSEVQLKLNSANLKHKNFEAKIRSYIEILRITIQILEVDKKTLLEEELTIITRKIEEEIPNLEMKYLNSIGTQVKILCETRSRAERSNGKPFICSLKTLLEQTIIFVDEVKKKFCDLKSSNINGSLKYALEKLNEEDSETICKLEDIKFINFNKSDDVINAFHMFILNLKQNAILLTKILSLSEFFYSKTLSNVFQNKLAKIGNRSRSSIDNYREKYKRENMNRSTEKKKDKKETPGSLNLFKN